MNVLYVEDDVLNRKVMRALMSSAGIVPDEAVDGEDGLVHIEANAYDIVLMDIRMPRMDGLEAIAHIRARLDAKARIPIIAVTADSGALMRDRCLSIGANDVLLKPVEFPKLIAVMARHVAGASQDLVLA